MDGSYQKTESGKHDAGIKAMFEEESAAVRDAHFAGAGGSEVVQRRTALIDRVLREIYRPLADAGSMPVLLAIGGYGRGELNPHSDTDIMFLCRDEADRQRSPEMLYRLWDAGLDVGYSVRTTLECVELSRQDIKIRASLIESRLIAGEPAFYEAFLKTMHAEVFSWRASSFITAKISERAAVRQKYGGSIYLREPNIKEGAGGLRDFHTALWVAFTRFRISSLWDLVGKGIITGRQYAIFQRSRNFLWRLRNELHYISGRKNDHLTYDMQERAARDFDYRDSAHLLSVERFMKAYFMHARNIREFSNVVIDAALRKPRRAVRSYTPARPLGSFSLIGKTLVPSSDDLFQKDPVQILTAFEIMQSRHAVFSDKLTSMIRECRIDDAVRTDPSAAATFLSLLDNPDNLSETLTLMKDLRFLGRYIPEFKPVQSLAKHDYYHTYTVDEHILLAIRSLQNLWAGRFPSLSLLYDAFRGLRKRWVLILAVLLHDLGKAYRFGHEYKGVNLVKRVLSRLGIGEGDRERIVFLVRDHLLMISLSQRRELTDRSVIANFARRVHDRENLAMLYLLTYADISAVSPTAWTQWKATLLQDLYLRTLKHFDQSAAVVEEEQAKVIAASERIRKAAEGFLASEEIDTFLAVLPEKYLLFTPLHKVIDHMGMMKRLPEERLIIEHRHYPGKGYTELTVCAYDAYGMFYRIAGTIAAKNLNVLRAQLYTTKNGVMMDTIQITDSEGNICPYDDVWESVKSELREALSGEFRPPEPGLYTAGKPVSGTVAPSVEFDNDTSDSFTIIDVTAWDRIGLLYRITKALYELNLDIASAKIVTEGVRVMDSFYVTDLFRKKITDVERLERVKESLVAVLE